VAQPVGTGVDIRNASDDEPVSEDHCHPEAELQRIESGSAAPADFEAVARHLLQGCDHCGPRLAEFWNPATLDGAALSAAVDHARAGISAMVRQTERARSAADGLVARLCDETEARRYLLIRNLEGARHRAVCDRLIQESRKWRHESAIETLRFAELAVIVADRLDTTAGELRTRAYAERGNAYRICGDLRAAESDFQTARGMALYCADPLFHADLLSFRASLAREGYEFDEAHRLLLAALKRYSRYGDVTKVAQTLIKLGEMHAYRNDPQRGIPPVLRALEIVGSTDVELRIVGLSVLLYLVAETGELHEAAELARQTHQLFETRAPRLGRLRFDWFRARLESDQGDYELALGHLRRIHRRLSLEGLSYDVALISLDLALTYIRRGRQAGPARSSALEAVALCEQLGVDKGPLARGYLFPHASETEVTDLRLMLGLT
jgi:tetratricopeptide (TPR) repeat protein